MLPGIRRLIATSPRDSGAVLFQSLMRFGGSGYVVMLWTFSQKILKDASYPRVANFPP